MGKIGTVFHNTTHTKLKTLRRVKQRKFITTRIATEQFNSVLRTKGDFQNSINEFLGNFKRLLFSFNIFLCQT